MKKIYRLLIVLAILTPFSSTLIYFACGKKMSKGESRMMEQFGKGIEKFKKVAAKNPEGKTNTLLKKDLEKIDTKNLNEKTVIDLGKTIKKDTEINKIWCDIKEKTDKYEDLLEKTFVQKKAESFPKFEKKLRRSTMSCGGLSLVKGSNREKYELGAYVTAADYLESYTPKSAKMSAPSKTTEDIPDKIGNSSLCVATN